MVSKFSPEKNKVYLVEQHSMFHIMEGSGAIQVDFQNYLDWEDKILFLDKGQYIKFLADDFLVRKIEFPKEILYRNKEFRVLFKHLVALGYINFQECEACQEYLEGSVFSEDLNKIIDVSSKQWFWQNPFGANREEYHLIFDVKEVIDSSYHLHLRNDQLSKIISDNGLRAQALYKHKIGLSIKQLWTKKRILESKKAVAFTDKSIKEVAYELGYKDPAYFNRVFKNITGKRPLQFREEASYETRDVFIEQLFELLGTHHMEQRTLGFYADQMHLSPKTISRKVREKLNITLGQLIRNELINSAKRLLKEGADVKDVAYQLGFEEANHFSAFFKHYTGRTPSTYTS